MSDTVFDKLHTAVSNDEGVELTAAEVWLLWELAEDALAKAEAEYGKWQDRFHELDLMKRRATEEAGGE